ncbi:hypothetical protein ACWA7J_10780 [Leptothrix sp. BB-4]
MNRRTDAATPEGGAGDKPVAAAGLPQPGDRQLLLMRALAALLLPLVVFGAGQASTTPGDMPLVTLATGPAVVLAMRWRAGSLRCVAVLGLLLALLEGGAQRLAQPHGLDWPERIVQALGCGYLLAIQAVIAARHVEAMWVELARDRRPPPLRRLAATARLIGLRLLPLAVVVALCVVGLHLVLHVMGGVALGSQPGAALWLLGWSQVLASGVSVLVIVPLLSWDIWPIPGARVLAGIAGTAAALAALLAPLPGAMVLLPAYTFLSGWLGGVYGAALASGLSVGLLLLIDHWNPGASPFDGPDGYAVLLLMCLRLCIVGLLGMVWNEPRVRGTGGRGRAEPRSGAPTFRNVMALEWHLARQGYGRGPQADRPVLWLHVDMPVNRAAGASSNLAPLSSGNETERMTDEPVLEMMTVGPIGRLVSTPAHAAATAPPEPVGGPADGLDSSLPSPRLPSLMQTLARSLRSNDAVVPIAGEALIVLVDNLDRSVVTSLIDRIDVLLLREGRRHLAPAEIRQAALINAASAAVLLTSARFLSIDL